MNIPNLRFPDFSDDWQVSKLGDVTSKIGSGSTPRGGEEVYTSDGILFIRSQNVKRNILDLTDSTFIPEEVHFQMSGSEVKSNDVLLNITGASIGRSCVVPSSVITGNVNQHVCIVRTGRHLEPNFLQPFLASRRGQKLIYQGQTGSGREGLNFQSIRSFKLSLPTKPEQQKIAAFLTAVDNKIEQLSKKQALLGEYKKGLMQQIFSQAIRFHSKGTSSQAQGEIDDTPGQPLLPNGNSPSGSDFPDWEEKKLGDITDLITKGTTPTSVGYNFTTEGINFIKVESIKNFKIDIGSVPKISEECHHHLKRSQLKNNDIVFSIAGTLGRTAIVKNKDLPANTNQALSIIRLNRSQHILFVHYLLNLESIDKYIHRMLSVGAQPNLSLQQVGDIQLQLPSLLEQSKITNFLSSIDNKIEQVGKQLDESKQFKKALLQQMFI